MPQNDPYIMLKESAEQLNGNDRYEGFCIDLLNHIAGILKFKYELVPVPGNAYGSRNKTTNKWNGMLRELIEEVCGNECAKRAGIGVCWCVAGSVQSK